MPRAADPTPEQPITRTVLLDVKLAEPMSTSRVEIRELRILPGHAAGLHVHNGPVVGSIVAGSAVYQIEPATVLQPGDVFYEPEGVRIARFDGAATVSRSSATSCWARASRRPSPGPASRVTPPRAG